MLYILLGLDDYSKKIFIKSFVKAADADLAVFRPDSEIPKAEKLLEADLFSRAKVFLFEDAMPQFGDRLEKIIHSKNQILVSFRSLDMRKNENKKLLLNRNIKVKEFRLPQGLGLNQWIEKRAGELGGKLSRSAVEELAVRLGRDRVREVKAAVKGAPSGEIYSLWQTEGEIKKLIAFTQGRQIETEDVKALVGENSEVDAFEIVNAIGEGKKLEAMNLTRGFLRAESASDEKSAIIKLNALLSEQMRSLAIMQDFLKNKVGDSEIAKQTGWKPGRLYIMKKISAHLAPARVLETLKKLSALDSELKTASLPPKVLLDLILAQIF